MIYSKVAIISTAVLLILSSPNVQGYETTRITKSVQHDNGLGSTVNDIVRDTTHIVNKRSNNHQLQQPHHEKRLFEIVNKILGSSSSSSSKGAKSANPSHTRGEGGGEGGGEGTEGGGEGGKNKEEGGGEGGGEGGKNKEEGGGEGGGEGGSEESGSKAEEGGNEAKRRRRDQILPYAKKWRRNKLKSTVLNTEMNANSMTGNGEKFLNQAITKIENTANTAAGDLTSGGVGSALGGSSGGKDISNTKAKAPSATNESGTESEPDTTTTTGGGATNGTDTSTGITGGSDNSTSTTTTTTDGTDTSNNTSTGTDVSSDGNAGTTTNTGAVDGDEDGYYEDYPNTQMDPNVQMDPNAQYYTNQPYNDPYYTYGQQDPAYFYGSSNFIDPIQPDFSLIDGQNSPYFYP
ncbi:hypothetical protein BJ944DRAFT_272759, partial [Cunninghamella echinulata]